MPERYLVAGAAHHPLRIESSCHPITKLLTNARFEMPSNLRPFQKAEGYSLPRMSLVEVVDDLLTLENLAEHEDDPDRRRSLDAVRSHLADRDRGAKVSEAADVLGLSQPTVRAWVEAGILEPIAGAAPMRVTVLSLADVKRALDLIRRHADDRQLLAQVSRVLRDREALADSEAGFADLGAGRVVPLGDDLRSEINKLGRREKPRSKSS